jgi:2-iminobutanoate/2-iminopropanoate deaminase
MKTWEIDAPDAPKAAGGYAQAVEVEGAKRLLFISGQIPVTVAGEIPNGFEEQCRLVWRNVEAQLRTADMSLDNLVKTTTFLSDRAYAMANRAIRQDILGERSPALTVVLTGIFDERWLLEIEAIAAA